MPVREVVRVRVPELKLVITFPDMDDREVQSLRDALAARPKLADRVDLLCEIQDFHRMEPQGPKQ